MKKISIKAIEEVFKTLKYKSPIISVNDNYITIQIGIGRLIISREKFEKTLKNEIETFCRN